MSDLFKNGNGDEKKVGKLKITDNQITFKEKLTTAGTTNSKYVIIDRQSGKYIFKAKKGYNWAWYCRKANVVGECSIVK